MKPTGLFGFWKADRFGVPKWMFLEEVLLVGRAIIAVIVAATVIATGTAFGAGAGDGEQVTSSASDRAIVRELRRLRSEMRRSTAELKALNDTMGTRDESVGAGQDVRQLLKAICRTSEITAQGVGFESVAVTC